MSDGSSSLVAAALADFNGWRPEMGTLEPCLAVLGASACCVSYLILVVDCACPFLFAICCLPPI